MKMFRKLRRYVEIFFRVSCGMYVCDWAFVFILHPQFLSSSFRNVSLHTESYAIRSDKIFAILRMEYIGRLGFNPVVIEIILYTAFANEISIFKNCFASLRFLRTGFNHVAKNTQANRSCRSGYRS